MKNTNLKLFLTLIFTVMIISLGTFLYFNKFQNSSDLIAVKVGDIVESIYGLGTVVSDQNHQVRTGLTLSIQKMYVREGDKVKPGDHLFKLDENTIRSPIEGTITKISFKEGELAVPQSTILSIINLDRLFLEVSLEQQSVLRIKKGQSTIVSFESLRGEKWDGSVVSIYPRENQFIVRIELKSWPIGVLPGMTADVAILVGKKKDVMMIPISSIVGGKITRIREGKKERISLKLGIVDGEWAEVLSDNLTSSDLIISRK